jgi:hypothetical protein
VIEDRRYFPGVKTGNLKVLGESGTSLCTGYWKVKKKLMAKNPADDDTGNADPTDRPMKLVLDQHSAFISGKVGPRYTADLPCPELRF